MNLDYLEINIVDHCNLKCKGCNRFCPLSGKYFADFDVFQNDLLRLRSLFDNILLLRLMGGEPLLHPGLPRFLECARAIFPDSTIGVLTNGTLLDRQPESFYETCTINNIEIQLTKYPIHLNMDTIIKKAERFNSCLRTFNALKYFNKFINNFGDSDPNISFKKCRKSYKCPNLREGKIYTCWLPPTVHIFNNFFGMKIHVADDDCVNIYGDISGSDILEFLNRPTPMCKWCLYDPPSFKWGISNMEINEWIGHNPPEFIRFLKNIGISMINNLRVMMDASKATMDRAWIAFHKYKRIIQSKSTGSITYKLNPIKLINDEYYSPLEIFWTSLKTQTVEVHLNAPDGPLFSRSGPSGNATPGNWVKNGTTFYLQDVTGGKPLSLINTLDIIKIQEIKDK